MMNILNYDHVIWDWNGTLINDVQLCFEIINNLLAQEGLPQISISDYKKMFTFPVINYYKALGFKTDPTNFNQLSVNFISAYEKNKYSCSLHSDAMKVLKKLQEYGLGQSILSAYHQLYLEDVVTYFGLKSYFNRLVGLSNIYAESKVENGNKWMAELKKTACHILLIGDTVHDYEVASTIGVDCLLIANGHQNEQILYSCPVPVIPSLQELSFYTG